ncbi:MAG: glycosyltransferase family 4 protein [Anaerolineae bacterium]|nr:glycosyltransferase family 4 protein [Anaerolineae bacterium]
MSSPKVWMIEPVGGHRGMHYYDFALCDELRRLGIDVTLLTCDETAACQAPAGLAVRYPFRRIFGADPAWLRACRYGQALRHIAAQAAAESVHIAHLHYFLLAPADLIFLHRLRRQGISIVITAHDVIPFNARLHTRVLFRQLYGLADALIVHTGQSRRELLAQFPLDPARVAVIPHGHYLPYTGEALLARQEARARLGLDPEPPVLLFFGQIKQVKGLDTLLRALPAVLAVHPQALLLIAGQVWKDDWSRYQALIDELALAAHVRARIAYIPDEEVAAYYRAADVVVLPYRRIYQSGVLLMAWSYARPVVASSVGGLAEEIRHGQTGLLVPPDDPAALAGALNELLADRSQAEAMGAAGRRLVEQKFAWDRIAARTAELYRTLADTAGVGT